VALVVADTFERAQAAAGRVVVKYDTRTPDISTAELTPKDPPAIKNERGDVESALSSTPVKLDVTYETPVETHNPMEMHATIATWSKDKLTLYETSQGVVNHRNVAAEVSICSVNRCKSYRASSAGLRRSARKAARSRK
jgi:xanthine dehydrogenase YagR molybdenum-binding subunit